MNDLKPRHGAGALVRDEILRRAADLAPKLRARAAEGEALRRMPDQTIADLVQSQVLRVCQPARFGGSELGWDTLCEMSIEMARGDGSQAWVANVYAEHAYLVALFADDAQHEVWDANPDALIAASVIPQGNRIERLSEGYRLHGRWSFTSGVHHADWIVLGEIVSEPHEHLYFLVPASACRIDDDWQTVGMVGTGSASVVLDAVVVPSYRVISNNDVAAGQAPGARLNTAPLYRMPLIGFAQLALASVPVGTAIGMVDDFRAHIAARAQGPSVAPGSELVHERLSEAAVEARAATLLLLDTTRTNMDRLAGGHRLDESDAARSMRDAAYAVTLAKRAAVRMFEAIGGRGLYLTTPMQRAFRDVVGAANHGSLNWERAAIRFARHLLSTGRR